MNQSQPTLDQIAASSTPLEAPSRQTWEVADELCKQNPGGMLTYHAEAFDEGAAFGQRLPQVEADKQSTCTLTDVEMADPEFVRAYIESHMDSFDCVVREIIRLRSDLAAEKRKTLELQRVYDERGNQIGRLEVACARALAAQQDIQTVTTGLNDLLWGAQERISELSEGIRQAARVKSVVAKSKEK